MATETTLVNFIEGAAASTPAASRVVTYAKADGLMYSKDDAGVETLMSSGAASGSVVKTGTPILYTGGNITVSSTTWAELAGLTGGPGTGTFDFTFTGCVAGDIAYFSMSMQSANDTEYILQTIATMVSGSPVNYFGGRTAATAGSGITCWQLLGGAERVCGGSAAYAVQSGDLDSGTLVLRPYARIGGGTSRAIFGATTEPMTFAAWLIRP